MGDWRRIDVLRDSVARAPALKIAPGPFRSLQEARETSVGGQRAPDRIVVLGWEIFLSRRWQGAAVYWHLSTRLHPHGRAATENDWKIVTRIAIRVGAPPRPVLLSADPRAAVHWTWHE